jgi:aminoglycoside 6'-N-acetyltransferase I
MSVKAMVIEHFTNSTVSEHFKNHSNLFKGKNASNINSIPDENIKIMEFTFDDMDACVELYKDVFSSDPWNDYWLSNEQVKYYLNELMENPVLEGYVAYENSKLIGVCLGHKRSWWDGKEFFIDELFVSNEMHGNGIGSKLMEFVEFNSAIGNYVRLTLLTNRNFPAEEFYLKKGFNINEKRIVMAKDI